MPVVRTTVGGRPAYRWGQSGKAYPYTQGDLESARRARGQAEAQGRAARARGSRGDAQPVVAGQVRLPDHLEKRYRRILLRRTRLARDLVKRKLSPVLRQAKKSEREERADGLDEYVGELGVDIAAVAAAIEAVAPIDEDELRDLAIAVERWATKQIERSLQQVVPTIQVFTDQTVAIYEAFIAENVALIQSMDARYFADLERLVQDVFREGTTTDEFVRELQRRFEVSESRARLIGRDQISKINAQVTEHRQTELGIDEYQWTTAGDERVTGAPGGLYPDERPSHYALDGQFFKWSDPPIAGRSGQPAHPGQAIQCRCVARAVISPEQRARLAREQAAREAAEAAAQTSVVGAPGRFQG